MNHESTYARTVAIVGVSVFNNDAPDKFGTFDRAFLTMFRLTSDGTVADVVPDDAQSGFVLDNHLEWGRRHVCQ